MNHNDRTIHNGGGNFLGHMRDSQYEKYLDERAQERQEQEDREMAAYYGEIERKAIAREITKDSAWKLR